MYWERNLINAVHRKLTPNKHSVNKLCLKLSIGLHIDKIISKKHLKGLH